MEEALQTEDYDFEKLVKNKNKRTLIYSFIRLGIVFLVCLIIGIYLLSPLSSVSLMELTGNIYLNNNDIYSLINVNNPNKTSLFTLNKNKCEETFNNYPFIKESKVTLTPFSFKVDIIENAPTAKYEDTYYSSCGDILDNKYFINESLIDYVNRSKDNISTFINEPNNNKYLPDFMYIVCNINKEKYSIEYLESSNNEKTFILYYKQDGNSPYFRVNLYYNDEISLSTYIKNLIFDENLFSKLNKLIENKESEQVEYLDKVINYYSFDFKFNKSNDEQIKLSISI